TGSGAPTWPIVGHGFSPLADTLLLRPMTVQQPAKAPDPTASKLSPYVPLGFLLFMGLGLALCLISAASCWRISSARAFRARSEMSTPTPAARKVAPRRLLEACAGPVTRSIAARRL